MMGSDVVMLLLILTTMLLWGIAPILEKMGLRGVEPLTALFIRTGVVTLLLFIVHLWTGRIQDLSKVSFRSFSFLAASGILAGLVGTWAFFYALKSGLTSKVVPITAAYPLVTAILGILILGEGVTLQRILGIILTIIGIVLIRQS
jgi:bacterial/archaeal transporter family protein